jgi:HD-GYP domain-containing protein (c-di-GMP phosphodiesterase class II)
MPEGVLLIVRNHHERLDGSGYPDQLRGGELPLALRIVCVADAYDAMRCPRHYRDGMSAAEALQELVKDAGSKFDPSVIEAVSNLTDEGIFEPLYSEQADQPVQLRVA